MPDRPVSSPHPIRVLIVDDHPLYRRGIRAALAGEADVEVVAEVGSAAEALHCCAAEAPDVVLLDVNLPDQSGVDVARHLRETQPEIGVVALTAYDDDAYVVALAEAGARGYLLKSASDAEIVGAVRAVAAGEAVFAPAVTGALLRRARGEGVHDGADALTLREREVLSRAAEGLTNREIGHVLGISDRTVQAHLSHIFDKLGVASRTEAVTVGLRRGLIGLDEG
jgi:DNA-binding NarL/FixJ family response regulator